MAPSPIVRPELAAGHLQRRPQELTIQVEPPTPASPSTLAATAQGNRLPGQANEPSQLSISTNGVNGGAHLERCDRRALATKRRVPNPVSTVLKALDTPLPGCASAPNFFPHTPLYANPTPLPEQGKTPLLEGGKATSAAQGGDELDVDYRLPHPSRPLEVRIAGKSLFVNPQLTQDVCPLFTRFLVREMIAGKQWSVETKLDQLQYGDALEVVRALCPTEMGMFPKGVSRATFPLLIRMASEFRIQKLRLHCEQFVLRLALTPAEVSVEELVHFFGLSLQHDMTTASKSRLLAGLLGVSPSRHLPNVSASATDAAYSLLCSIVPSAHQLYVLDRMSHLPNPPTASTRLKVPCTYCRAEPSGDTAASFKLCNQCRSTVCTHCASVMPCLQAVEKLIAMKLTHPSLVPWAPRLAPQRRDKNIDYDRQ